MVLHNIGGLACAAGRAVRTGAAAAREAVRIREATAGADHPTAAAERAALAVLLDATGRHDEAHELLHGALTILEDALGPHHHEVAVALANLAAIDARRGRLDSAERRLRRALTLKERILGAGHLELAPTLATLGDVLRRAQRAGRGQGALLRRALRLDDNRGLDDHPHAAALRASLGRNLEMNRAATAHALSGEQGRNAQPAASQALDADETQARHAAHRGSSSS